MQKPWKNEDVGIVLRDNTQKTMEIKITISELKKNFETMFFYIDEAGNEFIRLVKKDSSSFYLGFYNPDAIKMVSCLVWDRFFMPLATLELIKDAIEIIRKGE